MKLLRLEKGQRVRLDISFNGAYEVDVIHQTPKRKFTDILANGAEKRIDTGHVSEILNGEDLKRDKKLFCRNCQTPISKGEEFCSDHCYNITYQGEK